MSESVTFLSRRQFGFCLGGAALSTVFPAGAASEPASWSGPATVRKVYLAVPQPTWPRPDLDVKQEIAGIEAKLAALQAKHPGKIQFTGGEIIRTPQDVPQWAANLGSPDAVLVLDLTSSTSGILRAMRDVDVPMLLFSRPYAGWSYLDFANWVQTGKRADLIASSEFDDLDPFVRIFHTIHHLRKSKVLVVAPSSGDHSLAEGFTRQYGTTIAFPSYKELKDAYDAADQRKAQQLADDFTRRAVRVVEPSPKDILDSMRFYVGVVDFLKQQQANAITIDCLGGFRRGDLPAYPCAAWSKLNDAGYYGVCEADLPSTMTQLLVTSFCERPGFVSDPVFDTSKSEIIHAHCVAATAMRGIGEKGSPYVIRSHMEDNKGVSIQVLMPIAETVTVAKFLQPKKVGVSTGEVVANIDEPRGCRSKIRTRVPNARKMLEGYTGGLHRVVFYGDYVDPIERMGRLMGFQVLREA